MRRFIAEQILDDLGPLYHEYSFFGVRNLQLDNNYRYNQITKAPTLIAYVALAIALAKEISRSVTFAELFCADGFYAMVASRLGAHKVYGVDNSSHGVSQHSREIARRLGIDFEFIRSNVEDLNPTNKFSIVANVGGLYHVDEPEKILDLSYEICTDFLIVQNVVSIANDNPDYFERPAPGLNWGNRYSRESFDKLIARKGYNIVLQHFNELAGNGRLEDRGCVFYLIRKSNLDEDLI